MQDRRRAARPDGNVGAPGERQHGARVARGLIKIDVAGDGRDADEARAWAGAGAGVEQAERVVDAGVDVDDQGRRIGGHGDLPRRARIAAGL